MLLGKICTLAIIHTLETQQSAEYLLQFMTKNLLCQYVNIPTRENNTLDILISNDPNLVHHVSTEETNMSDHDWVNVASSFLTCEKKT